MVCTPSYFLVITEAPQVPEEGAPEPLPPTVQPEVVRVQEFLPRNQTQALHLHQVAPRRFFAAVEEGFLTALLTAMAFFFLALARLRAGTFFFAFFAIRAQHRFYGGPSKDRGSR